MVKAKKKPKNFKSSKQLTLDNLPFFPIKPSTNTSKPIQQKQIVITDITATARGDELDLRVGFKLLPTKTAFSKLNSTIWFDDHQIGSALIRVIQGPLAKDDFELTSVLDMKGINTGSYIIRVEMYEPWPDGEKLSFTQKEVVVQYVPKTRESRLIKIPIVKSFGGADLAVVSESDKNIYREIEETMKKESATQRDDW
ncbi:MAG: hypothetical protein ABSD92_05930 [Candidatus Bathyarchaeia archaeon]|jgi:hypothetical protein